MPLLTKAFKAIGSQVHSCCFLEALQTVKQHERLQESSKTEVCYASPSWFVLVPLLPDRPLLLLLLLFIRVFLLISVPSCHIKLSAALCLHISIADVSFLVLFCPQWPSFNGALASIAVTEGASAAADANPHHISQQYFCVANTLLSLLGSCLSTFATSSLLNNGKFDMMHIQNASLAGEFGSAGMRANTHQVFTQRCTWLLLCHGVRIAGVQYAALPALHTRAIQ